MNIVKQLRQELGLTQQGLAEKVKTSQATIAAYEAGTKSPSLSTLKRFGDELGLELIAKFNPKLTREDKRSLAYHSEIASRLNANLIERAKAHLHKLKAMHKGPIGLFLTWESWLQLPIESLKTQLLDYGLHARDMRQVSPFAGALSPQDRVQILKRFRKDIL